jgi:hypothetical protein
LAKPGTFAISGLRYQLRQPHQIVGGGSEGKSPSDAIMATEPGLVLPDDRLNPAECLLDALADALADGIAAVPGGSPINRRTAVERSSLTKSSAS